MDMHNLKKKLAITAAVIAPMLLTWYLFAQAIPGVPVNGPIVPYDMRDTYSTLDPWWAQGVFRDATNFTALDSIPQSRRTRGMRAYTSSDQKYWRLSNDLVTWTDESTLPTGTTNNIYNRDGTLTGNRTLDLGGNQLFINGLSPLNGATFLPTSFGAKFNQITLDGAALSILATTELTFITESLLHASTGQGAGWVLTLDDPNGKANWRPVPAGALVPTIYNSDGTITAAGLVRNVNIGANQLNFIDPTGQGLQVAPQSISANADTIGINGYNDLSIIANTSLTLITHSLLTGPPPAPGWLLTLDNTSGLANWRPPPSSSGGGLNSGLAVLTTGIYNVATPTPPYTSTSTYPDFYAVSFRPNVINAGNENLKWGSGPSKPLKTSYGTAIPSGELAANVNYMATFDAATDSWIVKNSASTLTFDGTMITSTVGSVTTVGVNPSAIGGATIYSANGSLAGDRTVDMNSKKLTFSGTTSTADFKIDTQGKSDLNAVGNNTLHSGANATVEGVGGVEVFSPLNVNIDGANITATATSVAIIKGTTGVKIQTPGDATATTGQALRRTATGTVEYANDTPNNLYTGDGSLTSARTVTMGPNNLSFNGSGTANWGVTTPGNVSLSSTTALAVLNGANSSVLATAASSIEGATTTVKGTTSVTIDTPGRAAAATGQALRKTAAGTVDYAADPAPANNSIPAAKISFANPQSFIASGTTAGAGTEFKLGPLWIIRNGYLQRNYRNIMFEVNSWEITSSLQDTANWQSLGGAGTFSGIGGVAGHAGILAFVTSTVANSYAGTGYRNDAIDFEPGNKLYCFFRVRIPTLSVAGAEAYKVSIGFGDLAAVGLLDTDCIIVTYTDNEQNAHWNLDCGQAGVHSHTDSGVTVAATAATVFYDIEIEATTTQVDWWIDGVQKTPYTGANIPQGANKFTPIVRIAGISGSTTRNFQLDQYNAWGVYSF